MHHIIYRFHKHILLLTACLSLLALLSASQLRLDLNFFSLLPSNNEEVRNFFEITEEIGGHSLLIALVETPPEYDRETTESFIDIFAENLSGNHLIRNVEFKSRDTDISSLFQFFMEHLTHFFTSDDLPQVAHILSDSEIRRQVSDNKKLLMTPFGIAGKELVHTDPLGLRTLLTERITMPSGKQLRNMPMGYYRMGDSNTYLLFIKPLQPPQDIPFSKKLMTDVYRIAELSLSEWAEHSPARQGRISISYTGGYPIAVSDETTTKQDIKVTVFTSFLTVLILFGLSFKTTRVLFYVGLSLIVSLLWTLAFAGAAFHHLNILTCIFSCVLIGLGIDFAIHIVNRYFDEDKLNMDILHRLRSTYSEAGAGILMGGITTAAAFFSIAVSDFRGFRELGIVTGTGILICMAVMFIVLPSLLVFFVREEKVKSITISGFGLKTVLGLVQRSPRMVLATVSLSLCTLALLGLNISFDDNLRNFRPARSETFRQQDLVTRWLGGSMAKTFLVVRGTSEDEVLEINASIHEALKELKNDGLIAGVKSINQYIIPPGEHRQVMEYIGLHHDAFDIKRIRNTFEQALEQNGFTKTDLYDDYFNKLSHAFSSGKPLSLDSLPGHVAEIFKPFVFHRNGYFKAVTYISPDKDLWSRAETTQFKATIIKKLDEKAIARNSYTLTGPTLLTGSLKTLIMNNLTSSLWLAGLIITALLIIYYRNFKLFLFSILPLAVGLATLTGLMVIFRLDFNFFNIIVVPMIVGIGIDDGVHLTNTYRYCDVSRLSRAITQTGRAIVLTSLTTLAGFGSLALSHYPGLQSMGYVAIIGISACLVASIAVLPALFTMLQPRGDKHSGI